MKPAFADWPCSVARVMEVFGDQWTPLIVRDAYYGITRFDDFHKSLGVARNTLSDRLNRLVDSGVLVRHLYQDNPPRNEYLLTDAGHDFFPVLAGLVDWGDRWLSDGAGPPVTLHHLTCGHDLGVETRCASCGGEFGVDDVEFRVGPGYPAEVAPERDLRPRLAPASPRKAAPRRRRPRARAG